MILRRRYRPQKTGITMRKSKLESYQEILEALVEKPSTIDNLSYKVNADCVIIRQRLDFLRKNGLVKDCESSRRKTYAISERGIAVLKALNLQRHIEKIKNTIIATDETAQIIPNVSRNTHKTLEK
jgi:predicted transcriptional regulator